VRCSEIDILFPDLDACLYITILKIMVIIIIIIIIIIINVFRITQILLTTFAEN